MTYDHKEESNVIVFSDGVRYTISECLLLSKGRPSDDDIRAVHAIKKIFDGVLEEIFDEFESLPPVPVKVKNKTVFYGRRKPREEKIVDENQMILEL